MRTPARAQLGRRYAGQPIGYRVLSLDGKTVAPFTRAGVRESLPGHYTAVVEGPDKGGWIVWGTAGNPSIAEAELAPAPPSLDLTQLAEALPTPPAPDLAPIREAIRRLRDEQIELAGNERAQRASELDALRAQLAGTVERLTKLDRLNESATQLEHLDGAARQFNELSHLAERLTSAGLSVIDISMIASEIAMLRGQVERMTEVAATSLDATRREAADRLRTLEEFDALLGVFEGEAPALVEAPAPANHKGRVLRTPEATLQQAFAQAFNAQGRRFVRSLGALRSRFDESIRLRESLTIDDWWPLFDQATADTRGLMAEALDEALRATLVMGAQSAMQSAGIDIAFNLRNPRAEAYLQGHGYGLITQINEVTRGNIATIIDEGVAEGWSYNRMAREISGLYSEMAMGKPQEHIDSRAHLIAVTEAGNAYEAGGAMVIQDLQESGLAMQKKWLTAGDARVSDGCRENQAEGWIPYERAHASGDQHPLRFPGCRCTELYQRRQD